MQKRLSKNDLIFIGILLAILLIVFGVYQFFAEKSNAARIEITVDGAVYGVYELSENQEIPIEIDGVVTNMVTISDYTADVTDADCPDKLCVHQKAISKNNETIVCLPNKVVVQVISNEESEFDSFVQ